MKRHRPELPNHDSTTRTFHYNTRSSSHKGISSTDTVDESAPLRVSKQRRKKKISDDRSTKSDLHLPIELVVEILKRLPVKTLARFLCVSKLWSSIIRSPDFMKLFLHESSNRPGRLFFNFRRRARDEANILFSSVRGEDSVATYHLTQPRYRKTINSSSCVHDLICYRTDSPTELVVYNSTTKRSITLPKLELAASIFFRHYLGYDPIDGVYKVLCMSVTPAIATPVFKVLSLGNGNEWREIENTPFHIPFNSQICTNGVLYCDAYAYDAYAGTERKEFVVMSFDVKSEKFHLIKGPGAPDFPDHLLTMTRYEDKLAIISSEISANGSIVLWVLEDALKHQWLKKVFVLTNLWKTLVQETPIALPPQEWHLFLNITAAGEFILAPVSIRVLEFYVLYYDPKRNSMRKVSIQGILDHELLRRNGGKPWFLYHLFCSEVESLMFW